MKSVFYCAILFALFVMNACKPDPEPKPGLYSNGVFIVNEGIYGQTSGTVTFYDPDSGTAVQDIFRLANGRDLGNVVQSLFFYNDRAYIVVNNSNKIEVANADDFSELAQITGLEQPRYFLPVNSGRALVTQWGNDLLSGSLVLIDLENNSIVQKITAGIGKGPERMLLYNNKVYISNVGGLEHDNFISVLNLQTMQVEDSIVTDDAPNSLQLSADAKIWVSCKGKTVYSNYPDIDSVQSTYGSLIAIDPANNQVSNRILLQKGRGASDLIRSGDNGTEMFFLYNNSICRINTANSTIAVLTEGSFYGLGSKNSDDSFYASTYSGIQPAKIYRIRNADGVKTDSFFAGVFANSIVFRP